MLPAQRDQVSYSFRKEWLLLIALLVGMVYLFLPPPWLQNDESTQFEYVWLVAHLDHWPQPGDMDFQLRRDVMASMIEHRFFEAYGQAPNLNQLEDPVDIGVSQMGGMPLYYFLASLPLHLFPHADVTQQLYLARLVSLALFLALVYCVIQATNLVFGDHLLGWMVTIFVALLPQLAYRMTAVNDDAAAAAAMTFFVWMCVRGLKLGPSWKNILGILTAMILCVLSKPTAWLAVPFGILAILLTIFHTKPLLGWASAFGLLFVAALLAFQWQASIPAEFYLYNGVPMRVKLLQKVDGNYSFLTGNQQKGFYQVLDKAKLTDQTKTTAGIVTFGVWVWSTRDMEVPIPFLLLNGKNVIPPGEVLITEQPVFITAQAQIPEDYRTAVLRVFTRNLQQGDQIYWDCLILVPGKQDLQSQATTSKNCSQVEWGDYRGQNLIRNASAEQGWFPFREKVAGIVSKFYRLQITDFWAVFDPATSQVYYRDALEYLFRTFWGRFNWGTLALAGKYPYRLFVVLSALAAVGSGVAFYRYRKALNWNLLAFFLLLPAAQLAYTLTRFTGNWDTYYKLLPQARYFFPGILPAAFFICAGWYALLDIPRKVTQLGEKFIYIFLSIFLLYNTWAWYTIWAYWYG